MRRMFLWVLASLSAGCGDGYARTKEVGNVVPVHGTVTYQSKGLENFTVSFVPEDEKGRAAVATTDATGYFRLGTNKPGDGAAVGSYRVVLTYVGPQEDQEQYVGRGPVEGADKPLRPPIEIPVKYTKFETTPLAFDVSKEGLPDMKIELK